MKRVLITGASGFIGRHCLPLLQAPDTELHAVIPEARFQLDIPGVKWHIADLLDHNPAELLVERIMPSHLLHLAWVTQPGEFWNSLENARWLRASLDLLQAFCDHGGQRLVVAGSCAEYDWRHGYCSENVTPLNPATLYGVCKKALFEATMSYAKQAAVSAAWGRVFFLYGPYEHPSRLVPSIITSLLQGRPAPCTNGHQLRDFLHVDDVACAFVRLLSSEMQGAVNLASGQPVSLRDMISLIGRKLDRAHLIQFGAIPLGDSEPSLLLANVDRLRIELGVSPRYGLSEGLDQTIEWWKDLAAHQ
jgi:nucleoside-diphosphate-sugar epimerase